jgi:hypothetical protein
VRHCTPGQLCSAAGLLEEADAEGLTLDDDTICGRMSANLCVEQREDCPGVLGVAFVEMRDPVRLRAGVVSASEPVRSAGALATLNVSEWTANADRNGR